MGQEPGTVGAQVTNMHDPEQIEREIEATRQQLGDTVEALARNADVKAQTKQKLRDINASVGEPTEQLLGKAREATPDTVASATVQASQRAKENPIALAAAGGFAVGYLAGRLARQ